MMQRHFFRAQLAHRAGDDQRLRRGGEDVDGRLE